MTPPRRVSPIAASSSSRCSGPRVARSAGDRRHLAPPQPELDDNTDTEMNMQDSFLYALTIPISPFILPDRYGVRPADVPFWSSMLLAAYGICFLIATPLVGIFVDRCRARLQPLWLSLVPMIGSCIMIGVGRSLPVLVMARVSQGCSAAIVWVIGPALLSERVGQEDAGSGMGCVSLASSLSLALSPILSGLLFRRAGILAVVGMAFGVAGWDAVLLLAIIEPQGARLEREGEGENKGERTPARAPLPLCKSALDDKTDMITLCSPSETPTSPTPSEDTAAGKGPSSSPDLSNLSKAPTGLWAALVANFVMNTVAVAYDAIIPNFVATEFRWDAQAAGVVIFALYGPNVLMGPWIGRRQTATP